MNELSPQIEPFINCIKELNIGNYLKSNEFKRYCIKNNFDQIWSTTYKKAKNSRMYFSPDMDHDYYDSVKALVMVLNSLWLQEKNSFYRFSTELLVNYSEWSKEVIDMKEFIVDLELLNFPQDHKRILLQLNLKGVPKVDIPEEIWNSNKLDDYLLKMDNSISSKEYDLTLTYAYTCLEGLYKSFIKQKNINVSNESPSIVQLSVIVRDYLKEEFKRHKVDFPISILKLISTITNAVAESRNSYSVSHFDKDSDQCLAEFTRDSTNMIGRMILKFI